MEEQRISAFLDSLESGEAEYLETIEEEALNAHVPIIRKETGSFLKVLLKMKQPKKILEIGTAVGFSALIMSEYAPQATITTIENYAKRIHAARENFKRAGKDSVIRLIEGDAAKVLKKLKGTYDFVFLDAAKAQYLYYLEDILTHMDKGGIIVTDNVLQEGDVLESRFAVRRRDRTIHARMRKYLYEIKHRKELMTSIIPLGDGVAVSVYLGKESGNTEE